MATSDANRNENAGNGVGEEKKPGLLKKLQKPELTLVALAGIMLGGAFSPMIALAAGTTAIGVAGGIAGERLVSKLKGRIQHAVKNVRANRSLRRAEIAAISKEADEHIHLLETQSMSDQSLKSASKLVQKKDVIIPQAESSALMVDSFGNLLFNGINVLEQGTKTLVSETEPVTPNGAELAVGKSQEDELLKFQSPITAAIRPGGIAKEKNIKGNGKGPKQNSWRMN